MGVEDSSMVKYCLLGYILAAIIIIITDDTIIYTSYEYATLLYYIHLYICIHHCMYPCIVIMYQRAHDDIMHSQQNT